MELDHLYGYLCIHQQTCASMKALLVADTLMSYPDRNFPFHIFTNVSDCQPIKKLSKNFALCH